jgi:3-oxoadipate enol-lactonase/4-carboxymuconolactone decarboxylase
MTPAPSVTGIELGGAPDLPLLVCGPSLGTSAAALWSSVATLLADRFHVVAWDLPGHGTNRVVPSTALTMAQLSSGVLAFVDDVLTQRGRAGDGFVYAGDSVGGAVGLQLLLDHPARVRAAALVCTAARLGEEAMWRERADLVIRSGTEVLMDASAARWFRPGFVDEQGDLSDGLLQALRDTDRFGYAGVCGALATFDVRDRLGEITAPVVAVAGAYDVAAPVAAMAEVAHGVADGRLVVLDRAAHQAPIEARVETARAICDVAGLATL